jgi:hypothetical protein
VNDAVSWSTNNALTLTASNSINVNGSITASGAHASLVLNANTANGSESASGSGTLNLGPGASITLSGANAALSINSTAPQNALPDNFGVGAAINLPNVSPTSTAAFVLNRTPYIVINQLGAPGSATGTDLQGIGAVQAPLGGLVSDNGDARWALTLRDRLSERVLGQLAAAASVMERAGRHSDAAAAGQRAAEIEYQTQA